MEFQVRPMIIEDYDEVYALWTGIHGFAMRSIDDSLQGVKRFLDRNPGLSVVAEVDDKIVGSILVGSDGRHGCFYHVCVAEEFRHNGIGKEMATVAMRALHDDGVNKVMLVAFKGNELGNHFWHAEGWTQREDYNYYDFTLNEENIIKFNS